MLALFFANSFFIWDFEVSGSETVPAEKILRVLEKQGLRRGTFAYSSARRTSATAPCRSCPSLRG